MADKLRIRHVEVDEEIAPQKIRELEDAWVDILFDAWLRKKGLQKRGNVENGNGIEPKF